jgi:hypothetical protein
MQFAADFITKSPDSMSSHERLPDKITSTISKISKIYKLPLNLKSYLLDKIQRSQHKCHILHTFRRMGTKLHKFISVWRQSLGIRIKTTVLVQRGDVPKNKQM